MSGIHCCLFRTLKYYYYYFYYLNAIGLSPGGSSTHLHTNSTKNTADGKNITFRKGEMFYKKIKIKLNKLGSSGRVVSCELTSVLHVCGSSNPSLVLWMVRFHSDRKFTNFFFITNCILIGT
jgi:hypothetical protein